MLVDGRYIKASIDNGKANGPRDYKPEINIWKVIVGTAGQVLASADNLKVYGTMRFTLKSDCFGLLHLIFDSSTTFMRDGAVSAAVIEHALQEGDLAAWANTYKTKSEFSVFVDEPLDSKYELFVLSRRAGILNVPSGHLVTAGLDCVTMSSEDASSEAKPEQAIPEIEPGLYAVEAIDLDVTGWELRINSAKLDELLSELPLRRFVELLRTVTEISTVVLALPALIIAVVSIVGLFNMPWDRYWWLLLYFDFPLVVYGLILWILWRLPPVANYGRQRDSAFNKSSRESRKVGPIPRTAICLTRIEDRPNPPDRTGCLFGAGAPAFANIVAACIGSK